MIWPISGTTEKYTDVAQMSDGSVFIGSWAGAYPLYKLTAYDQEVIAGQQGRTLFELTDCVVSGVTAPAAAGVVTGVFRLHPAGYALAVSGDLLQLWTYSAGVWSVTAALDLTYEFEVGRHAYLDWRIVRAGENVYLVCMNPWAAYVLKGSALATAAAEIPGPVRDYYGLLQELGQNAPIDKFRGRHTSGEVENEALRIVQADNGAVEVLAVLQDASGAVETVTSDGGALHLWTSYAGSMHGPYETAWYCWKGATVQHKHFDATSIRLPVPWSGNGAEGNRVWFLGQDLSGASQDTMSNWRGGRIDTDWPWASGPQRLYQIGPAGLAIFEATLEWARVRLIPSLAEALLEWSTGAGGNKPVISEASLEWGGGTGTNKPVVAEASLEWAAILRAVVSEAVLEWGNPAKHLPVIAEVLLEWSTGAGGNKPAVADATLEWGGGTGSTRPSVEEAKLEWSRPGKVRPSVSEAELEWAAHIQPGAGEGVLFLTDDDDERPASAIRVTTGEDLATEEALRVLVRADKETLAISAWPSYQTGYIGEDIELEEPGHEVRVGIMGSTATDPPDVQVVLRRAEE